MISQVKVAKTTNMLIADELFQLHRFKKMPNLHTTSDNRCFYFYILKVLELLLLYVGAMIDTSHTTDRLSLGIFLFGIETKGAR